MSQPSVLLSPSFDSVWTNLLEPWLRDNGAWRATTSSNGSVLLAPTRAYVGAIRQRMREKRINAAALQVWTPNQAREFLTSRLGGTEQIPIRENLHLLLSLTARSVTGSLIAEACSRDASRLMRTIDVLAASGHSRDDRSAGIPEEVLGIATAFIGKLGGMGWKTVQELDWSLHRYNRPRGKSAEGNSSAIMMLLAVGFDGSHWDLWPLLRALADASEETTLVFNRPRFKAEQIDQLWIGSWEQFAGEPESLPESQKPQPFATLAAKMESPHGAIRLPTRPAEILVGRNLDEQAKAVVALTSTWLASPDVTRIGIVVPSTGALAREISTRLLGQGIHHFDQIGHPPARDSSAARWDAWLTLQRDQKTASFFDFFFTVGAAQPAEKDQMRRDLLQASIEMQTDELTLLTAWLAGSRSEGQRATAKRLSELVLLPSQSRFASYIELTRSEAERHGWQSAAEEISRQFKNMTGLLDELISRGQYLDWLASITTGASLQLDPRAANPAALVHILPYPDAEGLPWSHLILAGLNEGQWPPNFDPPGFLREDAISELNRSVVLTGKQGEGHLIVKPDHTLILGPGEKRALARRQFYNLVEAPTHSLALTCSLEDDEGGRSLGPSDFLSHLFFTQHGSPLTEARLDKLHIATMRWLQTMPDRKPEASPDIEQTRTAHDARRAPAPFGPYEFALAAPPDEPITLACKRWAQAIHSPAAAWLDAFLGVEAESEPFADDTWPITTGVWVHRWLNTALAASHPERFVALHELDTLPARITETARRTRAAVEQIFINAHRPLPDRWHAGWANSAWIAGALAEHIASIQNWPYASTEWSLPQPTEIKLGNSTLRVRGRTDLVLAPGEHLLPGTPLWLFDFKTGSDRPLKPNGLLKKFANDGSGVQLALYALALRALGASSVDITLLTPATEPVPQINSADLEILADFWRGLARMQDTGIFGMRGSLRPEFGRAARMPLATLAIGPDLLEEKWALTHPLLMPHEQPAPTEEA